MEVACDRLLSTYLSRFRARPLFAELVKHLGCPTKTPRFAASSTLPMEYLGHEKSRRVGEIGLFMHDGDPFAPIALEPHGFGKGPKLFGHPVPTPHENGARTLQVRLLHPSCDFINPLPLISPQNMPRTF